MKCRQHISPLWVKREKKIWLIKYSLIANRLDMKNDKLRQFEGQTNFYHQTIFLCFRMYFLMILRERGKQQNSQLVVVLKFK